MNETIPTSWQPKIDSRSQRLVPNCWVNAQGFTVAVCYTPDPVYQVTEPGGRKPFAHTSSRADVMRLIAQRESQV